MHLPRLLLSVLWICACGDDAGTTAGASSGGASTGGASSGGTDEPTTANPTTSTTTTTTTTSATTTTTSTTTANDGSGGATSAGPTDGTDTDDSTGGMTGGGGGVTLYDPNLDGPWQVENLTGSFTVAGVKVPTNAYYPVTGPEDGPYPLVLIAHGFQLPAAQYTSYAQRLATHGYVAATVDYQAGLFNPDHVAYAKQVLGGIDWVAQEPTLAPLADTNNVGLTGHSLGGKLAILGAVMDPRVRASITLDPVDSATMCNADKCPDVSAMLPIDIPLGFIGETLDGKGGLMPCAPAADNFLTYFANASAPALAVTVLGANHMSFIDDTASCGVTCSFCNKATLSNAAVNTLSRAFVVAFYGTYLKGVADYGLYLTGAQAQGRYVDTGLATIAAK